VTGARECGAYGWVAGFASSGVVHLGWLAIVEAPGYCGHPTGVSYVCYARQLVNVCIEEHPFYWRTLFPCWCIDKQGGAFDFERIQQTVQGY